MNQLNTIKDKIFTRKEDAFDILKIWRFEKERLVFTNGCFDLIHRGHIEYLAQTADFGNRLIIGLNTDLSVQRLKGHKRPVNDEFSRALLLASMEFIDMVIFFDEDTPYELIKCVQPDILVKGSDYKAEDIIGYDIVKRKGGEIKTIDFIEGFSSSNIIERIKGMNE